MAINFKPINEVPVVEELTDGDKLLVNSGGVAKQIDASKIGGGGGGTVIYIKDFMQEEDSESAMGSPCRDAGKTQIMSTAELLEAFASGPVVLFVEYMGIPVWFSPMVTMNQGGAVVSMLNMGNTIGLVYLCSDTMMG